MLTFAQSRADYLNSCCSCQTLDETVLAGLVAGGQFTNLPETHPHLFAHERVFISERDFGRMQETVQTVEAILRRDDFRAVATQNAVGATTSEPHTHGVFNSYDFHVTPDGPALIEINTNAGGAFLAAAAAEAHSSCCDLTSTVGPQDFEARVIEMFESEWRLAGRQGALKSIAIVDDAPSGQFLYPDFLLARSLLERHEYEVVIADAAELEFDRGRLLSDGAPIDLVYNRSTDFSLSELRHAALRQAVETGASVVTPHPFHHVVRADKRNLVRLTNPNFWDQLALVHKDRLVLQHIPKAEMVSEINAERLWAERKNHFFKPICGHGSKGVYRGEKLTRSVWANIVAGGYIAQVRVAPAERLVRVDDKDLMLKSDLRVYTYGAEILLVAARLYQGQVTNMRTPSGGLAPVSIG